MAQMIKLRKQPGPSDERYDLFSNLLGDSPDGEPRLVDSELIGTTFPEYEVYSSYYAREYIHFPTCWPRGKASIWTLFLSIFLAEPSADDGTRSCIQLCAFGSLPGKARETLPTYSRDGVQFGPRSCKALLCVEADGLLKLLSSGI